MEPGSGGKESAEATIRRLAGFNDDGLRTSSLFVYGLQGTLERDPGHRCVYDPVDPLVHIDQVNQARIGLFLVRSGSENANRSPTNVYLEVA